ncbi:MAG TPA: alanine--glyoxylate aminotransferase family protein [Candidatus Dormibacteraeota bacterium]|nr:alanine--glyoxylate aminotransferase family protein [Candidatus Dormibacteraeota bacterium]
MGERDLVMIPGPTNVDPKVLRSMARPTLSHTSGAFATIFKETLADLGRIFKTNGLVLPLAGTGTLGAEVAFSNVIEPGDKVLVISGGYFGDRLADIAANLGGKVDKFEVPWGATPKIDDVEKMLSLTKYKLMAAVHVDTSTGVANPAKELGALARAKDVLFLLDTVCSMGGMDVQVDEWGVNVCFTGSQKALAVPPGMTIVSFDTKAQKAREQRKSPPASYYGDLKRWLPILSDPTKYFATPPVNMMYALREGCRMVLEEGLEERFSRHATMASAFRAGLRAIGLRLLCDDAVASNTLTVAYYPSGVRDAEFRKSMQEAFGVVVAGELGPLKDKAFRVGHMGNVNRSDILSTLGAIEGSLSKEGYKFQLRAGPSAANTVLTR